MYILKLFVTGTTPRSLKAIANLRAICQEHLLGRYELQVVDLYQQPELARENKLVAAPTLIKSLPNPIRRVIGDMSDTAEVLAGLDISLRERHVSRTDA
ncbi:KaiB [Fimbriimonas ginsengisoli Gsoil 348]|uniref:KaiB n=2 Tax=Fimbriimonas ginsengisoli TaxID=1005039 RepID=A0A068NR84_FIMGI|nr:KaiB [Fimbriimonas ginsengisoli Gsoil 348]